MIHLDLKKKLDFWGGGLGLLVLYPFVRMVGILLRRDHSLTNPRHIAVLKILGGGSLLMIYPSLVAIKKKYPQTKISLVCGRSIKNFAEAYKLFDHIQVIDDRSALSFLKSGLQTLVWLFREVDVSVDLEIHSRMTTLITTVAMVKNRIGLVDQLSLWRKRIYTHAIYTNSSGKMSEAYDTVAALFGIQELPLTQIREMFSQQIRAESLPSSFPTTVNPRITLGLGCSDLAFERQMPLELWKNLLLQIHSRFPNVSLVFVGGPADQKLVEQLHDLSPDLRKFTVNLCGSLSLNGSLKVIQESSVFMGIDSALIHLARTLAIPSVSFWGPTSPEALLRAWPQQELQVFSKVHCSPCVHQTEKPPCLGQNICMNHSPHFTKVLNFIDEVLKNPSTTASATLSIPGRFTWVYEPNKKAPTQIELSVR